jgi:hypothetical protein
MIEYGGTFVERLGRAWIAADSDNQARLKAAFPEYWEEYAEIVRLRADERVKP